jgi:hypothetical protein
MAVAIVVTMLGFFIWDRWRTTPARSEASPTTGSVV